MGSFAGTRHLRHSPRLRLPYHLGVRANSSSSASADEHPRRLEISRRKRYGQQLQQFGRSNSSSSQFALQGTSARWTRRPTNTRNRATPPHAWAMFLADQVGTGKPAAGKTTVAIWRGADRATLASPDDHVIRGHAIAAACCSQCRIVNGSNSETFQDVAVSRWLDWAGRPRGWCPTCDFGWHRCTRPAGTLRRAGVPNWIPQQERHGHEHARTRPGIHAQCHPKA